MRKIKKYANRKLYDTSEKKYVSLDELSDMIKAGEEVSIEDNETGEDITSSVVSQLLSREKNGSDDTSGVLVELLRKGGGTVISYAKKYTALWQNALTMAEDEVDKLVNLLIKNKEITESEGSRLKKEMMGYAENFKKWISNKIDQRVNEVMGKMNFATKEQVLALTAKIEELTDTVEKLQQKAAARDSEQTETEGNSENPGVAAG
ncbi:polyhydroxyalkanoate synthesis regulator DNA-binding domain-containing protein [Desulfococcaceae bacterium HSG8]|nr:polyhydroxyalkanoate synthesis regulator DNA-binding domain-containing protein [Desulfococcaceae bacterium HSG8]